MVETIKNIIPAARVSFNLIVIHRPLTFEEIKALNTIDIEISDPMVDYVGFLLEAEYTYFYQAVHSCV